MTKKKEFLVQQPSDPDDQTCSESTMESDDNISVNSHEPLLVTKEQEQPEVALVPNRTDTIIRPRDERESFKLIRPESQEYHPYKEYALRDEDPEYGILANLEEDSCATTDSQGGKILAFLHL